MLKSIVVFRECKDEINNLIVGKNPENLSQLSLSCHFNIDHDDLIEILKKANGNYVEQYTFIMNMASESDYMNVFRGAKFYYLDRNYKYDVDKILPVFMNYKFFEKDKINIAKNILRFLRHSNRKKIIFKKNI